MGQGRGTRQFLRRIFFFVLVVIIAQSCQKNLHFSKYHFLLDKQDQIDRVDYTTEELEFIGLGGMKGDPADYSFTVVASVVPPVVNGISVQACHIYCDDSKLYVAYNYAGETYRGAIDIYTYNLNAGSTTLTPEHSLGFINSDISCLTRIKHSSDSYEVFAVGATAGYGGHGLTSPAFMIYFDPTLTAYDVKNVEGYVATSIHHEDESNWFPVSSGASGGLTLFSRVPIAQTTFKSMTNMTSAHGYGNSSYALQTEPTALYVYNKEFDTENTYPLPAYPTDLDEKSTVEVKYGHSFLALNEGGTVIMDNSTNTVVEAISPIDPGGVPAEFLVSNGLSIGDYRLFLANGGQGLSILDLDLAMQTTVVGSTFTGQSVNHIALLEENGNTGYLAIASGKAGVKIIYYTYAGTTPTGVTTTAISNLTASGASSGGAVTADGGTVISSRGVCWSTDPGPTVAGARTVDGNGTGSFTSTVEALEPSTTYYLRAYATNNVGTTYGNELSFTTNADGCAGTFIDPRDNKEYCTVQIGTQTWTAQDMAYLPAVSPSSAGSHVITHMYVYDYQGTNVTDAKATANYTTYGVLYNWPAATHACPDGWHLPSDDEWKTLEAFLGMDEGNLVVNGLRPGGAIGYKLKSTSGWKNDGNGDNSSGFTAVPGGSVTQLEYGGNGNFYGLTAASTYWTSTVDENDASKRWYRVIYADKNSVMRTTYRVEPGMSVRCVKD